MAIQLPDLRQAVIDYVNSNVGIAITSVGPGPGAGVQLNPNDEFKFRVTVTNASAGGVALRQLRYRIGVAGSAQVRAPASGTSKDAQGQPINANALAAFFIYDPSDTGLSQLGIGEAQAHNFTGKIGANPGPVTLTVRVQADPDLNELFLRNETTPARSASFDVAAV